MKCVGLIFMLLISVRLFSQFAPVVYDRQLDSAGWVNLRNAIISVESGGDSTVVNGSSVGVLQITPVYVAEANRVLGVEKYCLDDRLSVSKSVEMFEVVQGAWNKERDLTKAIRLHNPRAGRGYYRMIIGKMTSKVEEVRVE